MRPALYLLALATIAVVGMNWRDQALFADDSEQSYIVQLRSAEPAQRHTALAWLRVHGDSGAVVEILQVLRSSDSESRQLAEAALWSIWSRSGDAEVDDMLGFGAGLMAQGRLENAIDLFTEVIKRRPDFAEGYNKRATALYYAGEYERSLDDIRETLRRNPNHFGALSGAGLCMVALDRPEDALNYIERALAINPNMEFMRDLARKLEASLGRRMT